MNGVPAGSDQGSRTPATTTRRKYAAVLRVIFGTAWSVLLFRLMLGPRFHHPLVCARLVWYLLYPVHYLRNFSNHTIYILFFVTVWIYVWMYMASICEEPAKRTGAKVLVAMAVLALPFIPFGIEYVSLARYATGINSYALRFVPFAGMLLSMLLANRLFFKQDYLLAGAWAFAHFLLVIVIVTLADLLVTLKSSMLLATLGYRAAVLNTFLSRMPIAAFFAALGLAFLYIAVFNRHFLCPARRVRSRLAALTPMLLAVALMFVLMIIRDDFRRYRYFSYRGGIATVYFAAHDDRQMLSFDENQFTLAGGRQSVFYPFGMFSVRDTLRVHADAILRMRFIEGLDYYRLVRIVTALAHGPRDTVIYRRLQPVIAGRGFLVPEQLTSWAEYLATRYGSDNDITVRGWVRMNGIPLTDADYVINRVTFAERKMIEPVWRDRMDPGGGFTFTCYKDDDDDNGYFQVNFSLPDTVIGNTVQTIGVRNVLPVFLSSGDYVLDTVDVAFTRRPRPSFPKGVTVRSSSGIDSFFLAIPHVGKASSARIIGAVTDSGRLERLTYEISPPDAGNGDREGFVEEIEGSTFFLERSRGQVEISIY